MSDTLRKMLSTAVLCLCVGALAAHALAAGEVKAWGDNAFGGLGDGSTTNRSTPVATSGLTDVTAVAGGDGFSLALRYDSTVWAWGYNADGELGIGTNVGKLTPVQIPSLSNVVAITSCNHHSLALKSDGTVWAWGKNTYGQLGDGTTTDRWAPVKVTGLSDVKSIATGVNHSLASTNGGIAYAWGRNEAGQVGDGSTTNRPTAVQVATITNVKAVSSHGNLHSLALLNDGTVWACGNNFNGQLGIGTTSNQLTPAMIPSFTNVKAIAGGHIHGIALKNDGTVYGWGYNNNGSVGDGTTTKRLSPVLVSGISGITKIATGFYQSFALKSDGTLYGWGKNFNWQLGDGTYDDRVSPIIVSTGSAVADIAGGCIHSLASTTAGSKINTSTFVIDRTGIITTTIPLKAYLRRLSDNAWLSGKAVAFKVEGTDVGSANTSASGEAALNWTITAGAASRTVRADFAGDAGYNASFGTATLTSQTIASKVYVVDRTQKIKQYIVLKVYLYTLANVIITGKPITVKVDGTTIGTSNTNASGYVQWGYTVPEGSGAGLRTTNGAFAGDGGYLASSNNGKLTVTKGDLYIWPYIRSGKRGVSHPLRAYVRSLPDYVIQPGKSITFKVNGSTIGTTAVAADGWATVNWAIPALEPVGAHTGAAEFAGDAWYSAVTATTTFNVVL
ncbi:MAG: Ig-like domain repeat protein [Armatimonadetes bacterium]|nr:Ig-like domain repeat protein [Armatimonadota bacterium]